MAENAPSVSFFPTRNHGSTDLSRSLWTLTLHVQQRNRRIESSVLQAKERYKGCKVTLQEQSGNSSNNMTQGACGKVCRLWWTLSTGNSQKWVLNASYAWFNANNASTGPAASVVSAENSLSLSEYLLEERSIGHWRSSTQGKQQVQMAPKTESPTNLLFCCSAEHSNEKPYLLLWKQLPSGRQDGPAGDGAIVWAHYGYHAILTAEPIQQKVCKQS